MMYPQPRHSMGCRTRGRQSIGLLAGFASLMLAACGRPAMSPTPTIPTENAAAVPGDRRPTTPISNPDRPAGTVSPAPDASELDRSLFDLNDLADPDPAIRRNALPRLPLAEYERVPVTLIAELAKQLSVEIGDSLPTDIAAGSAPKDAIGFLVDLAQSIDVAAASPGARALAGRVEVAGGGAPPRLVTAQMPIHAPGWFATTVADPDQPLAFHLHGHTSVLLRVSDVAPAGSGLILLEQAVTLVPLPEVEQAGVRGRIEIDGDLPPGSVTLRAWLRPHPINHPDGGYRSRERWPEPHRIPVAADGSFELWGFSPARHYLLASAEGYEDAEVDADLAGGRWLDLGSLRLVSSDLSYYVESDSPEAPPLDWIEDPDAAFALAAETGRPLMAFSTAEWCAPCQLLESTTFEDPWVRGAMAELVLAKVEEDEAWSEAHEAYGYPTLLFFDSEGREVHRFSGYRQALPFLRELLRAFDALALPAPAALQTLMDEGLLLPLP